MMDDKDALSSDVAQASPVSTTHDELLNKLDKMPCDPDNREQLMLYVTLRAVVELHKPVEHAEGTWCSGCMATEWYPCPTIQAIEKELQ